jgi:hypothetical protein
MYLYSYTSIERERQSFFVMVPFERYVRGASNYLWRLTQRDFCLSAACGGGWQCDSHCQVCFVHGPPGIQRRKVFSACLVRGPCSTSMHDRFSCACIRACVCLCVDVWVCVVQENQVPTQDFLDGCACVPHTGNTGALLRLPTTTTQPRPPCSRSLGVCPMLINASLIHSMMCSCCALGPSVQECRGSINLASWEFACTPPSDKKPQHCGQSLGLI